MITSPGMETTKGEYTASDDKSRLDLNIVCDLLHNSYWAQNRSREAIKASIENSICFGIYHRGIQVGFGRAITDQTTWAYLCDIIITPEHRGRGLGKWFVQWILAHPAVQTDTVLLRTKDAHGLYAAFGFQESNCMRRSGTPDLCRP